MVSLPIEFKAASAFAASTSGERLSSVKQSIVHTISLSFLIRFERVLKVGSLGSIILWTPPTSTLLDGERFCDDERFTPKEHDVVTSESLPRRTL